MERLQDVLKRYLGQPLTIVYLQEEHIEIVAAKVIGVQEDSILLEGFRPIAYEEIQSIAAGDTVIYERES